MLSQNLKIRILTYCFLFVFREKICSFDKKHSVILTFFRYLFWFLNENPFRIDQQKQQNREKNGIRENMWWVCYLQTIFLISCSSDANNQSWIIIIISFTCCNSQRNSVRLPLLFSKYNSLKNLKKFKIRRFVDSVLVVDNRGRNKLTSGGY